MRKHCPRLRHRVIRHAHRAHFAIAMQALLRRCNFRGMLQMIRAMEAIWIDPVNAKALQTLFTNAH